MYLFLYFIIKKNQDKTSLKFVIDIKKASKRNHITKESINEKPWFFLQTGMCIPRKGVRGHFLRNSLLLIFCRFFFLDFKNLHYFLDQTIYD